MMNRYLVVLDLCWRRTMLWGVIILGRAASWGYARVVSCCGAVVAGQLFVGVGGRSVPGFDM
jgi:hypothetical protein